MIRHPESVKCLHIHGWDLWRWCVRCRKDWEELQAEPGQERELHPPPRFIKWF